LDIAAYATRIAQDRTIRLVATARLRDPVLFKLVDKDDLSAIEEIEGATSGRLRAQGRGSDRLDSRTDLTVLVGLHGMQPWSLTLVWLRCRSTWSGS
jgi:hypothetical protein